MKFCWVTLPVKNFEESLEFYTEIFKLEVVSKIEGDGIKMAMLGKENEPQIELLEVANIEPSSTMSVGLEVESLDDTIEYLIENHIEIIRGPISPMPSIKFLFINDPNGYEIQLVENMQ